MTADVIFLIVSLTGAFLIGVGTAWYYFSTRNAELFTELNKSSLALDNSILQLDEVRSSMQNLRGQLHEQRHENSAMKDEFKDLERKLILSSPAVFSESVSNASLSKELGLSIFNEVPPECKDELTKVDGISPFLESKLNDLGLRTFEQLSQLNEEQVRQLNDAIECFPGRIKEEKWVAQCAELANERKARQ